MTRLLLYSQDRKLQPLLAPTLGSEFPLIVESSRDRVKSLTAGDQADVLILDFDSEFVSSEEHAEVFADFRDCGLPIVAMTDDDRRSTALELLKMGINDYFSKPPSIPELKIIVRRAHEHASLKREVARTRQQQTVTQQQPGCDRLVGSCQRSQVVYDLVRRVANLNAFVLVNGESGTGKELVARAIHNLSNRADQPFVAVSCGAIPETLIESELFGHEKGAFTGSTGSRAGYFEQAEGGTLFLDEIGELSQQTQVKLLRVLQQREFNRLGSSKSIPLRARVVFATHRNLAEMVEQGTFRRDLYYRVNVMRINVPALRDRTEDIPALANHFLREYSDSYQKPIDGIQPNAMALLCEYDWPGNVRELENAIQQALILAEGATITPEDLPETMQQPDLLGVGDALPSSSFEDQLRDYKIRLANKAIADCHGNKTLAARSLNISRAYLHRLIRDGGQEANVA